MRVTCDEPRMRKGTMTGGRDPVSEWECERRPPDESFSDAWFKFVGPTCKVHFHQAEECTRGIGIGRPRKKEKDKSLKLEG